MSATRAVFTLACMRAFMLAMYADLRKNAAIFAGSAIAIVVPLDLARRQRTVGDVAWRTAMIPPHAIAILTSERATTGPGTFLQWGAGLPHTRRHERVVR